MEIVQYYQTNNPCYQAGRKITSSGIVVHSTGANNSHLKRYVGPDDGILGVNKYGNHWNKPDANKCVHAFIGRVADGTIKIYQTLPWDYRCRGVGSGKNGSYKAIYNLYWDKARTCFRRMEDGTERFTDGGDSWPSDNAAETII